MVQNLRLWPTLSKCFIAIVAESSRSANVRTFETSHEPVRWERPE